MKMGEVVEDANSSTINIHTSSSSSSQQQHLQVASNVLVEDDEDEDDAENGRLARQYSESLRDLQLNLHDNDSSNAKSSEESETRRRRLGVSPFTVLLPKQVEKRRRDLNRRYLQVLKRTRAKEPPRNTLKAKKIFELRFLEATYVRNVLYQSLPHCQLSASLPAATSSTVHSGNVLAGSSTPQGSQTVNNVSGGSSGGTGSSSNSNNSRLSSSDNKHAVCSDGERTLFGVGGGLNDHSSSSTVVPICSVITDYKPVSGVWYKCLKSKAMNARKPNHLIQATYEQCPPRGKNKQWLSSQPKKVRTSQRSVGGGGAPVVVLGEKSTSSSSTSAALAVPSVTPVVTDKNKNSSSINDDSKKSSSSATSSSNSNNATPMKLGLSGDSRPASDTPLQVLSNKETNINVKATPPVINPGRKITFKLEQMRPRSLDKEGHHKQQQHEHRLQAVKLEQNHTPSSNATSSTSGNIFLNNINSQEIANRSLSTPVVASGVSKEELEKGRKTSSTSSPYLTIALNNNTKKGGSGSDASKSAAATTSSSNSSELSLKSVISENTDSSSSSTTSGSTSSNSFSDSLSSSLRASSNNGSTTSTNIASANNSTAGNSNNNTSSSSGGNTRANNSNLNSSSTTNELTNTSSSSPSSSSTSNHGGGGSGGSGSGNAKSNRRLGGGTPGGGSGGGGPKAPKKYSEKMKAEASVVQRISELQKEGMWWEKRLPKVYEPPRAKSHWDYLLEEMTWMSSDFMHERKWKRNAAKKCSRMIEKYFHDKALKRQKAEKEEEARKKRMAGGIAKLVRQFWANVQTVVEFKEQTMIESIKKKALDQKLSYLVNETEKYSEIVAQTFTAIAKKTGIDKMDSEGAGNDLDTTKASSEAGSEPTPAHSIKEEVASPAPTVPMDDADTEFVPPSDSESDVDDTIAEEEAKERVEVPDHKNELEDLERENSMSYEELIAKYANFLEDPEAFKEPTEDAPEPEPPKPQETSRRLTRGRVMSERQLRTTPGRKVAAVEPPPKTIESDVETDVDDDSGSSTEEESQDEEDENGGSDAEKTNEDLASLLKSISGDGSGDQKRTTEEETNKLADLAESFKPKGNTLSSTTVVTKVPHLLRHTLREYQHIGLDWLVAMYDKKLNGILADEMGLGKTIQTIALLAYLAVDRCNWGPHLIIVPTSVMLNWEMEFKKWCPGFKILTYYGSQKERKLKRSGWTKPNAFHVCITSYKLVIQDHQSFRRKRWKYLILDEAQNIKNFKSQRWQLLLNFHTQRRLLLTGTPLQNNLMELWSLLHFLMPNVFQSHMEFKDWFSNPMSGMVEGSQEYNEDIVRRLHKVLRPFILRRMKTEVEKQLPQKYEHVVMCSLSKRQRYLYEEFMARSKTKDTLNQGNLLSVINVLMQLRKVCNHPNLFEPRPIVSPFQTEGINYRVPACVWDVLRELNEDSFRQYFPLFTVSNIKFSYSEDEAQRIGELTPLFAYNPDEERRYVVMNYQQCGETKQPPAKRVKRIVNLVKNEPPPCPRLQRPLTFFMTNGPPDKVLQDKDFMEYLRNDARQKQKAYGVSPLPGWDGKDDKSSKSDDRVKVASKVLVDGGKNPITSAAGSSTEKPVVLDLSDSDNDDKSSSDSDFEVVVVKKRKIPVPSFNVMTRLQMMGATVPDFELDYIQERRLQDRKLVVNNLNKVNWARCRVQTCANSRLLESCQIVGALPPIRLTSRKTGFSKAASSSPSLLLPIRERPRDYISNGYFNLGFDDIMKIIRMRRENPDLFHHPFMMWQTTKHLDNLVTTPERRLKELMSLLTRYVMYIPAVRAPALESIVYRPASSTRYFSHLNQIDEYRKVFSQSTDIVHPIISRMHTHFPDPRLIQYDCGKLQTLDTLLRRLKTGSHRVLIFTQMAKVLDILEAFLNYHGHTYLRLDGATKIDQRQLLMERFNADKKIFCFILSTRSGGIGVNLTGADTVIFYDSDWNPTMDAQAQDRCHRIGQTRDVHIYRLVSEKTVEENILKKSNQKRLLGELAIEGGKFTTTYFKQHTIRELFAINEKDDVAKRLNSWNTDPSSSSATATNKTSVEEEEDSSFDPADMMRSPEKKHEMQMIECALAAAEDDTDVQAAQTVHAEAEAEMAEFDENVSLDALDDGKSGPNKFDLEFQQVYSQLTGVERYAIQLMESTIDDWSKETVAQAQKDLEEQKMAWELQQQQKYAQESPTKMDIDDDDCPPEDILTYSRLDNINQVWVAQFGTFEQEMLFPIYEPPTPPHDDMDVYFDTAHGYLYDYAIMNEDQLPPVYIPKHPKKPATPVSTSPVSKPGGLSILEKTPEAQVIKDPSSSTNKDSPEMMDLGDSDASPQKKSPKVGRREDPIFAPKSLFDKPSPALAKIRRDLRLQRYSNRPASHSPKTSLGPGSITFPIVNPAAQKTPPPPAPVDSPSWLIAEDYSLLNTIKNVHELPTNLMLINTGQTPNWDYAHEAVNTAGLTHRTAKQCKWRYENVVAPREEGKIVFETPASSSPGPTSPSSGKKKKSSKTAASFIKINPPSPSKASRLMKVTQLLSQDNNAQYRDAFCEKFDTVKAIANKRAPTTKPVSVSGAVKTSNKHSQVVTEMGINYDNPLSALSIAQSRYDRIQLERKKLEMQRQQQVAMQQATQAAASMVGSWSPSPSGGTTPVPGQTIQQQQQQQQQQQPQTLATASVMDRAVATIMATSTISTNPANATPASAAVASKVRGQFTSVTIPGGITPLVLASSSPEVNIHRDVNIPNIIAQQRTVRQQQQQQELTAQQQQLLLQQQKQAIIQHQQLTNLLNQQTQQQQQQQLVQTSVATSQQQTGIPTIQSQNPNVTVLTAGGTVVGSASQAQQPIRSTGAPPIQVQTQQQTQTVMIAPGLAQALAQASSVGSPISVSSSSGVNTSTPMTAAVNTTPTSLPAQVQRHLQQQAAIGSQPQLQRVPTITMQDLVSSAAAVSSAQRIQAGIISTSAPTVPVSAVSSQSQPTLVSLTPMISVSSAQQFAPAKLLNAQGLALVQSSPTRAGVAPTTLTAQQAGSKLGPLQIQQYLSRSGIMRPSSPTVVSSPLSQQQQVLKEQLMPGSPHQQLNQIKRIQVVAASPPPTMVTGASNITGQQGQVTLPSVSTITSGGTQYSTIPAVVQATSSPVVTISSTGTTSKVALAQPNVTMAAISSANVSPASASTVVQGQRQVQLVKQHTVGGKTVTRPVTDAEVAAFLKHHGIPAITNTVSGQSVLPGSPKNPTVATFQGSVPVQGSALLTVGLQNIMKVQQSSPGGSVATLVKSPGGQGPTSTAGQTLAFPVHLSKINTAKGNSPGTPTSAGSKQQQVQTLTGVQQLMLQRRQQQDQQAAQQQAVVQQQQIGTVQSQQQTSQTLTQGGTPVSVSQGGKIAHITTQVTPQGTIPTHVVVQTQKQLPNTIAVQQLQQVFKQVGAAGQVITGQGGQVLQAQMIGKPIAVSGNPNTITVTTSGGVTSSQSALNIPPTSSVQSSAASLVHIPNLVQAASSSGPIHARIVPVSVNLGSQQPGGVKQTIQVMSGPPPPNATLIGTGPLTVRPPPPVSGSNVQTVNSIQIKLPTSSNMPSQNPDDKNN